MYYMYFGVSFVLSSLSPNNEPASGLFFRQRDKQRAADKVFEMRKHRLRNVVRTGAGTRLERGTQQRLGEHPRERRLGPMALAPPENAGGPRPSSRSPFSSKGLSSTQCGIQAPQGRRGGERICGVPPRGNSIPGGGGPVGGGEEVHSRCRRAQVL